MYTISIFGFRNRYISVCLSIVMNVGVYDEYNALFLPEWTLGSCYGPPDGWTYVSNEVYYDRCCLPPGKYTLICKNTKSKYGWGNSIFKINGKQYCDDFVGMKAMRTVFIEGNRKKF